MPFLVILFLNQRYIESLVFLPLLFGSAFLKVQRQLIPPVPTPFYKRPFEFVVGFRKSFFLIFLLYSILTIALVVSNLNLGIFAMMAIYLVLSGYYSSAEPSFFVWIYALTPANFLGYKIRTVVLYSYAIVFSGRYRHGYGLSV